jgi:hypothetical protein
MPNHPVALISDTTLTPGPDWPNVQPVVDAMVAWCQQHGIDAMRIPQDSTIERDVKAMTITYDECVADDTGSIFMTADGTAERTRVVRELAEPPAPWPAVVLKHGTKVRR